MLSGLKVIACVATCVMAAYLSPVVVWKNGVLFSENCNKTGKEDLLKTSI